MLLAVDVGNTSTEYGVFEKDRLVANWRLNTHRFQTADELGLITSLILHQRGLRPRVIDGMTIASVVPPVLPNLREMARTYFDLEPLVVGPGIKTGIPLRFDHPREIGADRICNAVATIAKYGGPAIIVDFGTSTNFDAISPSGEYLGGAIAPGIRLSMEALFGKASRLPQVDLSRPPSVIGKNTVDSLRAGIFFGVFGQIKEIVTRMAEEITGNPTVIATGPYAELFTQEMDLIAHAEPHLTLQGLQLIFSYNQS